MEPREHRPHRGLLVLTLSTGVCAISSAAIFIRMAEAPGITTAVFRTTISALLMAIIAQVQLGSGWWKLSRKELKVCSIAGVFLGLHFWAWMTSLEHTSVASSVLFVAMNPIFVGILSPFVTGDKLDRRLWLGIALAVVGSLIVGYDDLQNSSSASVLGNALALLGALCGSGYLLAGRIARRTVRLQTYAAATNASASALLIPIAIAVQAPFLDLPTQTYLLFVVIAVIPQLIGHNSLVWSLKHLSPTMVSLVILAEPIGSGVLAYAVMDETPTQTKILGALVLMGGIFVASLRGDDKTIKEG